MIETHNLRRVFKSRKGAVEAVAGVDLDVKKGEIFGFLGPNGAGKTTTLRMLSTLLPHHQRSRRRSPASTSCTNAAKVRYEIGYVSQEGSSAPEVPGRTELVMQGRLYGMTKHARGCARRGADRRRSSSPTARTGDEDLLRRAEAPARHRHRAHAPAAAAVPRRADDGPRPAEQSADVGRGSQAARHRHDRVPDDALPRGGGCPLRPHRHHRPRQDRRPRNAR